MKKIILTESQVLRLKKNLNEYYNNNDQYNTECKVYIETYGVNYKGNEINYINSYDIKVSYYIDIDARSWGIKDINIHNIKGPTEYELEIDYYPNETDDSQIETVLIKLDWDNIEIEEEEKTGFISVGDEITFQLKNDESGNIVCDKIVVPINTL